MGTFSQPSGSRQAHVIVVDDDSSNAELTRLLLELDGFSAVAADSIETALAATTADADAFIIDYHLVGNTTGLTLLEAIRAGQTAADRNAVVIFISGDIRGRDPVFAAGADEFLQKPVLPGTLRDTLTHLLSRD